MLNHVTFHVSRDTTKHQERGNVYSVLLVKIEMLVQNLV